MIAQLANLRTHPAVFRHLTGLTIPVFDTLAADVVPGVEAAHHKSLDRPGRQRAIGAGGAFELTTADQVLLAVVWLRQDPTQEALGFLGGVSDSTALRAVSRCLPVLERAGADTIRMPDPGPGRRTKLPARLAGTHVRAADPPAEAAAAGVRLGVEHAIGRLRRFRSLAHVNRHRRTGHAARVRAAAGLVNRMLPTPTA
jgi:hypothetical protein